MKVSSIPVIPQDALSRAMQVPVHPRLHGHKKAILIEHDNMMLLLTTDEAEELERELTMYRERGYTNAEPR